MRKPCAQGEFNSPFIYSFFKPETNRIPSNVYVLSMSAAGRMSVEGGWLQGFLVRNPEVLVQCPARMLSLPWVWHVAVQAGSPQDQGCQTQVTTQTSPTRIFITICLQMAVKRLRGCLWHKGILQTGGGIV